MIVAARWCLFMFVLAVAGFLLLALCASPASACERCGLFGNRCAFRQVQAVHVQQLVAAPIVYPQVNYFVGAPIRVEAIVQKSLQENPEYAEFQRFRAWQMAQQQAKPDVPMPNTALAETPKKFASVKASCATSGCHGGDAPAKGLLLDGTGKLNSDVMRKAMKRVSNGTMPPAKSGITLTPESKGNVFQDLLEMSE